MNLFCYGTLMLPEVMQAVIGRCIQPTKSANLGHFRLNTVRNSAYPAIRPDNSASVSGVVYQGLRTDEIRKLDEYEGIEYYRVLRKVRLFNATSIYCWVYVYKESYTSHLLSEEWSLDEFKIKHLASYLQNL